MSSCDSISTSKAKLWFYSEFFELLTLCVTSYDKILIVGDFNIHVDNKSDRKAVEFVEVLHSFSFTQHVNGPTHNKEHTLDLIISYGVNVNVNEITDLAISDHFCLFFDCKINIQFHPKEKIIRKRFFRARSHENTYYITPKKKRKLVVLIRKNGLWRLYATRIFGVHIIRSFRVHMIRNLLACI